MDIRQMRQVLAVGRAGSFSKAAKELGIAQPTLSYSIARLEDELGVKLFDRSGWKAEVTPIGEYILDQAAALVAEAHRFDRSIRLFSEGEIGEIRIGVAPALRAVYMAKLSSCLVRGYPKLKIIIIADNIAGLKSGVASGNYDMIFIAEAALTSDDKLVRHRVLEEPAIAVAAPGHPLVGKKSVGIAELSMHKVIGYANSSTSDPIIFPMPENTSGKSDEDEPPPRFVTNDIATVLELVREGVGLYAGPAHVVHRDLETGDLVRLDMDWSFTYRAVAAMTVAASLSPLLMKVVAYAQQLGAELASQNVASSAASG